MTLTVRPVRDHGELEQILELQRANHSSHVSAEEARAQGFVTARHSLETLSRMHDLAPSIVAKDGDQLAGYALMMREEARALVPILDPLFETLSQLSCRGTKLADLEHYVMGQICVALPYRGRGVFDALYQGHKECYSARYPLIVTEIATRNTRSLRAHERVGFEPLHRYRDDVDEWLIVAWDWSAPGGSAR